MYHYLSSFDHLLLIYFLFPESIPILELGHFLLLHHPAGMCYILELDQFKILYNAAVFKQLSFITCIFKLTPWRNYSSVDDFNIADRLLYWLTLFIDFTLRLVSVDLAAKEVTLLLLLYYDVIGTFLFENNTSVNIARLHLLKCR